MALSNLLRVDSVLSNLLRCFLMSTILCFGKSSKLSLLVLFSPYKEDLVTNYYINLIYRKAST